MNDCHGPKGISWAHYITSNRRLHKTLSSNNNSKQTQRQNHKGIILIDNGGDWTNKDFIDTCDYLGINIKTSGAESSWSNAVVETTLANMMDKRISDANYSPELALTWPRNAKNSLQNVAGFSLFQLVLGKIQISQVRSQTNYQPLPWNQHHKLFRKILLPSTLHD